MWGKRKETPAGIPDHVTRRVHALSTDDLYQWSEQAVYTAGRYLTMYRRSGDDAALDEAHTAAQVLLAITQELTSRR